MGWRRAVAAAATDSTAVARNNGVGPKWMAAEPRGMARATGFVAQALPTARDAVGCPIASAISA